MKDISFSVNTQSITNLLEQQKIYDLLAVACQLDLFSYLTEGETAEKLATRQDWDEQALAYLLEVFFYAGYLEKKENKYFLTPVAQECFLSTSFFNLNYLFTSASSLGEHLLIRLQKKEVQSNAEPGWNPERLRQIGVGSLLSSSVQTTVKACHLSKAKRLLDLGGGHAFYSIAFAQAYPTMQITLFDLPQVLPIAEKFLYEFTMDKRIDLVAGNFLTDAIGENYDAVLCSNILHGEKRDIVLQKVWQALNKDGCVIVKSRVADCAENLSTALAKLQWYLRAGKELFTQEKWRGYLVEHGFEQIELVDLNGIFATFIGWKK